MAGAAVLAGALPGLPPPSSSSAAPLTQTGKSAAPTGEPVDLPEGLFDPRQKWMWAATAGLFLHWGMRTVPEHMDGASWEEAVTSGGWSADYWVDEARASPA